MNEVSNVISLVSPTETVNLKQRQKVNFRAGEGVNNQKTLAEQEQIDKFIKQQEKDRKNAKRKSAAMTTLQVGSLLAMIGMAGVIIWQYFHGSGQAINTSKLIFEDLTKDKSLPDLATAKSIDEGVRKRFLQMIDADKMPKDLKERIGLEVPPKAMALLGNSGVGKTFITKVYAKAINADYLLTKFTDITSIYEGEASKNVEKLGKAIVKRAKENPKKPIVWLIDEADPLMKPLNSGGGNTQTAEQIRSAMLKMLEETNKYPNLKVFIATNQKVEKLDAATLRRLGQNYEIPMPNEEVLLESLKFQLKKSKAMLKDDKFDFYKDQEKEIAAFIKNVYEQGGAHGDIETIVKSAITKCGQDAMKNNTPTNQVLFDIKYLNEALTEKGKMAGAIENGNNLSALGL